MKRDIINEIRKKCPLRNRLRVLNEIAFISLLTELGFREDKMWSDDEDEMLQKLCDFAEKHTLDQLNEIKEWEVDGKPE